MGGMGGSPVTGRHPNGIGAPQQDGGGGHLGWDRVTQIGWGHLNRMGQGRDDLSRMRVPMWEGAP